MALRAARELQEGMYVNLGIGLPTLIPQFVPVGMEVVFQSENGMLGYGGIVTDESQMDVDLINAGNQPVTLKLGASFFDHATSFAMIRRGRIDLTILGAYQVSERGDLANWKRAEERIGAIGGAMDLVYGAKRVVVLMKHTIGSGAPRIVKQCTDPLSGREVVDTVITDLAVIKVRPEGMVLTEIAPGIAIKDIQALTEPTLIIAPDVHEMKL